MVQRGYGSGFRLALQAKNDHVRVLQLDPDYIDAKLVVGSMNTWWEHCLCRSSC